ncbi:MAG: cytochrome c [Alphaproteobacteria bacterium]|nr:cytochrome c [Alphaproteobacteria bacterium]
MSERRPVPPLLLIAIAALAACDDMANQPKQNPYESYSITAAPDTRTPPENVVAREAVAVAPPPVTASLLHRGQARFDIYCAPCHGRTGDGDGMIVQRGFPRPPSYHIDRLREAPVQHFYDVITHGYGAMFPYAARVAPQDRWAIAAYIRALQESQHQPVASLSDAERGRIE